MRNRTQTYSLFLLAVLIFCLGATATQAQLSGLREEIASTEISSSSSALSGRILYNIGVSGGGNLEAGVIVTVTGRRGSWYLASFNNREFEIHASNISLLVPVSSIPVVEVTEDSAAQVPPVAASSSSTTESQALPTENLTDHQKYVFRLYRELLGREPDLAGFHHWVARLDAGEISREAARDAVMASPEYRARNAAASTPAATATATGSETPAPASTPAPAEKHYGYDKNYFAPVWDIATKFAEVNQQYLWGGGHKWTDGYNPKTDCSGFVGSWYQKLAAASGVTPAFPQSSGYGNANSYTKRHTEKITAEYPPPNPPDKIQPGDIMVTHGGGHIVIFMGYDRSGNPLIAHSTTTKIESGDIAGNTGLTGVRIEVMPARYRTASSSRYPNQKPFQGVYRIKGTDEMLKALAAKASS